jgi:hypothetical protein
MLPAMGRQIIYVSTADEPVFAELKTLADRRGSSLSAEIARLVKNHVRETQRTSDMGLPVGFRAPASMKDPVDQAKDDFVETLLATVREKVDEVIELARKQEAS